MKPANPRVLTINGGSSSIKFALFEAGDSPQQILDGVIERIGLPEATLRVKSLNQADNFSRAVTAPDHAVAVGVLMDWIEERSGRDALAAVGHRVVAGPVGPIRSVRLRSQPPHRKAIPCPGIQQAAAGPRPRSTPSSRAVVPRRGWLHARRCDTLEDLRLWMRRRPRNVESFQASIM
jgi:Acetokinase family